MGIVAAHPQVVPAIYTICQTHLPKLLLGFSFVDMSWFLTPPCVPVALPPYFSGDFATGCSVAGCQDVPLRGIKFFGIWWNKRS